MGLAVGEVRGGNDDVFGRCVQRVGEGFQRRADLFEAGDDVGGEAAFASGRCVEDEIAVAAVEWDRASRRRRWSRA